MNEKKPVVVIAGPTAIGKTNISIKLAKKVNGEIISADSMQVYKGMDIGTAKITKEEMQGVPHFLIDVLDPKDDFNIVYFKNEAVKYMNDIWERGNIPIIVGGTGFYIQSVIYDIDFTLGDEDQSYREELNEIVRVNGCEYLHNMLKEVDVDAAKSIHSNDVKRVVRALEYYKQTGQKISEHNINEANKVSPYNFSYFVLNDNRESIYDRIDRRVDIMIENGLVEEVRKLISTGLNRDNVSMKGLGYKEIIAYLENEISLDEAVRIIKRDTRHFAKRQLTWFKRERCVEWIYKDSDEIMLAQMITKLREKGIIE